jgi:hypothetical protein
MSLTALYCVQDRPTGRRLASKRQDNDVHYEVDTTLATLFETRFQAMWDRAKIEWRRPSRDREVWFPCLARSVRDRISSLLLHGTD